MKYLLLLPLFALSGCLVEEPLIPERIEIDHQPIVIQLCADGWLFDQFGAAVLNQFGQAVTCSEAAQ